MSNAGLSDAAPSGRLHAVDTAKGIGILFVVFGHAWRGAFDAGLLRDAPLFHVVDNMIYAWHMPLFFFLSGLLFLDLLERIPSGAFVWGRITRLFWPMALWTWIFFGLRWLGGDAVNHPVALTEFPLIPLPPYEHLWFLWALLLAQMAVFAAFLIMRHWVAPGAMRVFFGVLALVLTVLISLLHTPSPMFGSAIEHFPYFVAGMALGGFARYRPPLWLAGFAAAGFALFLFEVTGYWASVLQSLVLTVLLCVVIAWLDRSDDVPGLPIRALRLLGRSSLAIFLTHTIFSAAFRIGLVTVGVEELWLHLAVATLVGLLGPLLLVWISRQMRLQRVIGF